MHVWDLHHQTYQMCHNPGLKIQRKNYQLAAHTSITVTYQNSMVAEELQRRIFRRRRGYGEQSRSTEDLPPTWLLTTPASESQHLARVKYEFCT